MLFEGMRTPEKLLALRLHGYLLDIIEDHMRMHKTKTIPLIETLVFYNGEEPFEGPLSLKDLVDGPAELAETMFDNFPVLNIKVTDDARFLEDLWYGFMALAMKHIDDEDIMTFVQEYSATFTEIKANGGQKWIHSAARYLFSRSKKDYNERDLIAAIQALDPEIKEDFMSIAEMLQQAASERTREKTLIETAKNMFAEGATLDFVKKVTKLSDNILNSLMPQNPSTSS